jgi:hypothetical protein
MQIEITGPDFMLSLSDLSEPLSSQWPIRCGGDATEHVEWLLSEYDITCDPDTAKAMLRQYGAWVEPLDLSDHKANMERLVWLIGCDLGDTGEAYLSTY